MYLKAFLPFRTEWKPLGFLAAAFVRILSYSSELAELLQCSDGKVIDLPRSNMNWLYNVENWASHAQPRDCFFSMKLWIHNT